MSHGAAPTQLPAAVLYPCTVMHRRTHPVEYRFEHRILSLMVDIDRLDEAASGTRWFSVDRFNLFSLHRHDHGPRDGSPLRPWVEAWLARHGIDLGGGPIQLLAMPRVLGYGFDPLSLWYCYHRDGTLRAVLCQVRNTFGEHHGYLLHADGGAMAWPVRQQRDKGFYVSPFVGMAAHYRFRLSQPGDRLGIVIREFRDNALFFVAAQQGHAARLTDRRLVRAFVELPLSTLNVIAMIHWHALKLWLRGVPFHHKPAPPSQEVS